jgi:hypothetical protein
MRTSSSPEALLRQIEVERKKVEELRKEKDMINLAMGKKKDASSMAGLELAISASDSRPVRLFRTGREGLRRDTKEARRQLSRRQKLVIQNSALRDVASAKLKKITSALSEVKETKTLLLRTLNVLVNRLRDSTISKEDNSEMLRMLDPYIRYLMNSEKQDEMPPPPPFVDDSGILENESMIFKLLESLSLPFSTEETEKLVLLLAGKRSSQVPMQVNVESPSIMTTTYNTEDEEEKGDVDQEEEYSQKEQKDMIKPRPLIHRPAFGSSTPTMRRPQGSKTMKTMRQVSVWMGDDGHVAKAKMPSPRSMRRARNNQKQAVSSLQSSKVHSPQQVAAFVHKFTMSQRKNKNVSQKQSPSKLDDSGIFASPYSAHKNSFEDKIEYDTKFEKTDLKDDEEEENIDDLDDMNELITSALSEGKRYGIVENNDDEDEDEDELGISSGDVYSSALASKRSPEGSRNRNLVKSVKDAIGGEPMTKSASPRLPPPPPVETTLTTTMTATTTTTTTNKKPRRKSLEKSALADARLKALPPGSIRREGNYWVVYYKTIHNDVEHYVGRFRTEIEALDAYEKRAEYYSHRDREGNKRRQFFQKYDVSSPTAGGTTRTPPGIDISLEPIPHDLVMRTDFLVNKMQAETYARGGKNIDNFLVHLTAPHKREAARMEQALPIRDFLNTTKRLSYLTEKQARRVARCLQPDPDNGLISFENLRVFVAGKWPNGVAPEQNNKRKGGTYAEHARQDVDFMSPISEQLVRKFLVKAASRIASGEHPTIAMSPEPVQHLFERFVEEIKRVHLSTITHVFVEMDKNKDDAVNKFEFRRGMQRALPHIQALDCTYDALFFIIDKDQSGHISLSEMSQMFKEERLRESGKIVDDKVSKKQIKHIRDAMRAESYTDHGEDFEHLIAVYAGRRQSYFNRASGIKGRAYVNDWSVTLERESISLPLSLSHTHTLTHILLRLVSLDLLDIYKPTQIRIQSHSERSRPRNQKIIKDYTSISNEIGKTNERLERFREPRDLQKVSFR